MRESTVMPGLNASLNIVRDIAIILQLVKKCQVCDTLLTLSEDQGHQTGDGHIDL